MQPHALLHIQLRQRISKVDIIPHRLTLQRVASTDDNVCRVEERSVHAAGQLPG